MPDITYREALRQALHYQLVNDDRVFLMGEDIGAYGGSYAVTKGFLEEFGERRVKDTPISESVVVGAGIGAAMAGLRPMVELMTINFSLLAIDQIVNNASKLHYMSNGQISVPLVMRMAGGAGSQLGAQHSHSLEGWFAHVPGLKVVVPATPYDAKGLLMTAFDDGNPIIFIEHTALYTSKGEVPEEMYRVPFGKAELFREGNDITLIGYSGSVHQAFRAAQQLAEEGIDARGAESSHAAAAGHRRHRRFGEENEPRDRDRRRLEVRRLRRRDRLADPGARLRLSRRAGAALFGLRRADAVLDGARAVGAAAGSGHRRVGTQPLRRGDDMISEVVMPQMGADMTEGTVLRWLKHEGDEVDRGEIIAEIETDKANVEIEAFEGGTFRKALAEEGDVVKVGEVIAVIGATSDDVEPVRRVDGSGERGGGRRGTRGHHERADGSVADRARAADGRTAADTGAASGRASPAADHGRAAA